MSLRNAELVERRTLRLNDLGRALIDDVKFEWKGKISGYGWMERTFNRAQKEFSRDIYHKLGSALFDPDTMRDVAKAIYRIGSNPSWKCISNQLTSSNKQLIAEVGSDFARFSKHATRFFWSLLTNPGASVEQIKVGALRAHDWRNVAFQSAGLHPLRESFDNFLKNNRYMKHALIELHEAVWALRGHPFPWINASNGKVRPDISIKHPPTESNWDLRWIVAHKLIHQTGWKPQ